MLIVLEARGIEVSEKDRQRFMSLADQYLVERWMMSAAFGPDVE
ncbi:hypothetical protein [Actinomadura sp. B10D3]